MFKGLDGDGDVRIKINSGTYAWSPYLVELNVGAEVERGRDWRWGDQDGGIGKRGRVTELGDWVTVKWDDSSSSYRYRWGTDDKFDLKVVYPGGGSQVVPAPAGCVIGGPVHIKVVSKAELERLQTGHGGMTDSMLAMMGKEGTLRAVDSDGDCRVEVEGDRKLWNPAMIEAVGAGGFLPGLKASAIDLSDGDSVATPVRLATSTRASAFVGTVMYPEPEDRVAPYAMAGGSVVQSARQNYFEVEIGRIEPGVGVGVGLASPTKFNCASDDMVGWKDGSFRIPQRRWRHLQGGRVSLEVRQHLQPRRPRRSWDHPQWEQLPHVPHQERLRGRCTGMHDWYRAWRATASGLFQWPGRTSEGVH